MDEKAKNFLERQGKEQGKIIGKIRKLILDNFPGIKETGMAEGLWYEGKFYIASFWDHVNLGVGVEGLSENEKKEFEGNGKTMRHLKFYSEREIADGELLRLLELVAKKSKCGCGFKWRN